VTNPTRTRRSRSATLALLAGVLALLLPMSAAHAESYPRITGDGSSWAGNALFDWTTGVKAQGVTVDYNPDGSSQGRKNFAQGLSDFAVSEIPYKGDTSDPQDTVAPNFAYGMLPVVAGGTSFMYNLQVNGQRYQDLRLSQSALAQIFSGQITQWNDKAIAATNPGVALPAQRITVVVRSDGSGATAQFTLWMRRQFPAAYAALCAETGCNPDSATSYYPYQGLSNFVAQSGSNGVTTYTANTPYTINYDEYSYALGVDFPVAKIQNAAGFYTVPTDTAVAVALTQAKINQDKNSENYLGQDLSQVYGYRDPRTYAISAYSYLIVPTETHGSFNAAKGSTLAYFGAYDLCEGQRTMGALGYSPLPMNLVLAAMDQVERIPGIDDATSEVIAHTKQGVKNGDSNPCNNPTFKPGDDPAHNVLIDTAPFPDGCDAACQKPWTGVDSATNDGPDADPGKGPKNGGSDDPGDGPNGDDPSGGDGPGDSGTDDGAGPTGPGSAPGGADPSGDTSPACDPDTGICGAPNTTSDGIQVVADPAVIGGQAAWGGMQVALVISVLLGLGLLVGPPVVSRLLARGKS
jgi:phosphate ABC transporter phosphate-binding protein